MDAAWFVSVSDRLLTETPAASSARARPTSRPSQSRKPDDAA